MQWIQRTPKVVPNKSDEIQVKLQKIFGIDDLEEFLNPSEKSLHDASLLTNIDKALSAILQAIKVKKKIYIFADIDADGLCSGAIMYNFIKIYTDEVELFYNQRSEGHGICQGKTKVPNDCEFLLIVDSSTSDTEACKELSERGMEIVILDHHIPERENPYALIVNPQCCDYPNKFISGAGVCWKVVCLFDELYGTEYQDLFVDLAGVGIYADAMDMTEKENRYIVGKALDGMQNAGLLAILKVAKRDPFALSSTDIGFTIAPNLNGASRMDKIELAMELLTTQDVQRAHELAKAIKKLNDGRKDIQKEASTRLMSQIDENDKVIVLIDNEIGKSFAGLVAGELAGKFQRPVMILSDNGKALYSGSYRSYEGFELKSFLNKLPKTLVAFTAGHEGAGGVGVPKQRLAEFKEVLNKSLANVKFERVVTYDLELDADEIDELLIQDVQQFTRIAGQGIPEAQFKINGVFVIEKTLMGSKKDTVKVECDNEIYLMKFRTDDSYYQAFPEMTSISVVGTLNLNKWMKWKPKRELVVTKQVFITDFSH